MKFTKIDIPNNKNEYTVVITLSDCPKNENKPVSR